MRINFPMWLLDEQTPRSAPFEPDRERKLSLIDRRAPLFLLYQSLTKLGHHAGEYAPEECDLSICWTAKRLSDRERDRCVIMEVGWLPRSRYQISPTGSNALGHFAGEYQYAPLGPEEDAFIRAYLEKLRALFDQRIDWRAVETLRKKLPEEFILFPLQLANDFNLKGSGTDLARFYSPSDNRNHELAVACIELAAGISAAPVVFKQHPFDPSTALAGRLRSDHMVLDNAEAVSTHDLFATGRCKAVISINSNTVHEAAAWNIPSICLGTLVWSDRTRTPPFSSSVDDLPAVMRTAPHDDPKVLSYLHYLVRHQWTLLDFQNELMVKELLDTRGRCEPMRLRQRLGLL